MPDNDDLEIGGIVGEDLPRWFGPVFQVITLLLAAGVLLIFFKCVGGG